jgi:prolyl oligopeptidase
MAVAFLRASLAAQQPPPTPVRLVVDTLYGTAVPDPYRWLENLEAPEVRAWFRSQGAYARAALDSLPGHADVLARLREIDSAASPVVSLPREAGGRWFFTMRKADQAAAHGYARDVRTGGERELVDPATVPGAGGEARLATFVPSPDGRLVIYGITTGGGEQITLRVRDVATGRDVDGPVERNQFEGTAWWDPSGRVFYYWRAEPPSDSTQGPGIAVRLTRHRIGDRPSHDVTVSPPDPSGLGFAILEFGASGTVALGGVGYGQGLASWFAAPAAAVATGTPSWRRLFGEPDSVRAIVPHGAELYVLTLKGTPRILRTRLDAPRLAAADTVMVGGKEILQNMSGARDGIYVQLFSDGVNRLARIPWGGRPQAIELPAGTSAAEADVGGQVETDPRRSGALLMLSSATAVTRPFRYDPASRSLGALSLRPPGRYDRLEGHVFETVFATSHDGVHVPLSILRPERLARDGSSPVILSVYGAYGLVDPPGFEPSQLPWLEAGGVSATCHVRGGGYYGETWHRAGQVESKPNSWLDLIACAEHLVSEGYTRPVRLVIVGGSAAGIAVGRAMTERPDLLAGVMISNGVLDALRNERTPVGAVNRDEFGSASTEAGFRSLLAMSAYHHVRPATSYPAALLMTGLDDIRVPSWEPGKMAAALLAATTGGRPVLLRVNETGGHASMAVSGERLRLLRTDWYTFAMWAAQLPEFRPPQNERR